ncbi:MAG: hypothetical protein HRT35_11120 [Algicola sp.]|nr:hypothetical protein [Algicola sp.]
MNPVEQLAQYSTGHWVSQMVYAFAKNAMGDAFEGQVKSSEQIANTCELEAQPTYRLLRALAPLGIVKQHEEQQDHFELTELGSFLTSTHPMSMVDKVLLEASYEHVLMWTHLAEYLKTGEMAPSKVFGLDNYFGLFDARPEHVDVFSKAMSCYTNDEVAMINAMPTLDFTGIEKMVDVGGAYGALLKAILGKHTNMQGILFDQQAVVDRVAPSEQMAVQGGDFFTNVPADCDGYFLKHILHDWDDALCATILGNVVKVMKPDARIFIGEFGPVPGPNEPHLSKMFDLHMMICLNGKERTMDQWTTLLARAGLTVKAVHQSFGPLCVIEAQRA